MAGTLYFGDNLHVLREHFKDESVDLIYLDPPFNSSASYNVLFKSPKGDESHAQIKAFDDTWHWGYEAEQAFDEVMKSGNSDAAEMLEAIRRFLKENDMMAYLSMMAIRLIELHRVLKTTGSFYLHCDPTASHYLKIVLDAVFGKENYRNEISWKRSQPKSHTTVNFAHCRDIIFRYSKSDKAIFNKVYGEHDAEYLDKFYRYRDKDGRRYQLADLTNPNKNRPNLTYEFLGVTRVWRWTKTRMQKAYKDGLIVQAASGSIPRLKRYLDEMSGQPITDDWDDIEHLHGSHEENMGYPTQKPLALLERIIQASSNPGDIVLDPFCGCGTTVHAAEKLKRWWYGIDVTHIAISKIEQRMKGAFPQIRFEVIGRPEDLEGANDLARRDKYQFQWWALDMIGASPYQGKKKGADSGIDGLIFFKTGKKATEKAVVSVKGGQNVGVAMIRDLGHVIEREGAKIGVFITLVEPTREMEKEAAKAGFYENGFGKLRKIQILTIANILKGKQPHIPLREAVHKKAAREEDDSEQELMDL